MNIKNFLSFFRKKNKSRHVKNLDKVKSKIPKGQEYIYWITFINKNNIKIIIPIASILLFSLLLFISIRQPVNEKEIYTKNFIYDNYYITRGTSNIISYNIEIKNYNRTFKLLEEEIHDSTQYMYIYYYSLMAMELNKHDIAQKNFIKLIKNNNNLFLDDAQWFLALSYLKTDKEKAIEEFRKISNNKNHYKRNNAKKILKQLQ